MPSCWPPPFPQASAHGVPHCSQHQPGSAAGLPASARRPGTSPALLTPQHRHPTRGVEWGRETTAAWAQRPWAGSSLCPAHPAGGFQPQVTKGWGHCPTASPTLLGPLAGPFPSPPPTAATGEHCQAQAQGGDGALPTRWTLLSSIYMFLLPPHGGSQDPGAWKEAVPQEPKKVSTSIIGALEPYHQASDGAASARPPAPVADRVGPAGGAVLSAVTWDSRGPF